MQNMMNLDPAVLGRLMLMMQNPAGRTGQQAMMGDAGTAAGPMPYGQQPRKRKMPPNQMLGFLMSMGRRNPMDQQGMNPMMNRGGV